MSFFKAMKRTSWVKREEFEQVKKEVNEICEMKQLLENRLDNCERKNNAEFDYMKKSIIDLENAMLSLRVEENELVQDFDIMSRKLEALSVDLKNLSKDMNTFQETKNVVGAIFDKSEQNTLSINKIEKDYKEVCREFEDIRKKFAHSIGAVSRETMRTKWAVKDSILTEKKETVQCVICGCVSDYSAVQKKITECRFAGGILERYVCPNCGAIFGPLKFRNQSEDEYNDDYVVHYLGFNEADCTKEEKKTFYMLNPRKDGVYLNYGCGKWADTISELREEGYNVYGYEPFAAEESEFIITDKNVLKRMRFDGIFSHDLLEHLINPVEEILFMKSLLLTSNGFMAHATACYEYKFEYTRFHTCFFTGNAVEKLCERTGMKVVNYEEDEYKNFMCYVYGIEDKELYFESLMAGERTQEGALIAEKGNVIYGPGLNLVKGKYCLNCQVDLGGDGIRLVITAEGGTQIITSFELRNGTNEFCFELQAAQNGVEFVINTKDDQRCRLEHIWFSNEEEN